MAKVYRDYVDVSVAVASPRGLVVPMRREENQKTKGYCCHVVVVCCCWCCLLLLFVVVCCCLLLFVVVKAVCLLFRCLKSQRTPLLFCSFWRFKQ